MTPNVTANSLTNKQTGRLFSFHVRPSFSTKTKVKVAFGTSLGDSKPEPKNRSGWDWLEDAINNAQPRGQKDGDYFIATHFGGDGTRTEANAQASYALVFDVDENDVKKKDIIEACDTLECKYYLYSSFSHKTATKKNPKAKERWRLIIPLKTPLPKEHFSQVQQGLIGKLGLERYIGKQSKNVAHLFYLPVRTSTYDFHIGSGRLHDWQTGFVPAPKEEKSSNTDHSHNTDLWQKIKELGTECKADAKGAYQMQCPVHTKDGRRHSPKSLVAYKDGGVSCLKKCSLDDIRAEFRLAAPAPVLGGGWVVSSWGDALQQSGATAAPSLFANAWFEGGIAVLFGADKTGKTPLAVQIARDLTEGNLPLGLNGDKLPPREVLYFDFELSEVQQRKRYSEQDANRKFFNDYPFNRNKFKRVDVHGISEGDALTSIEATIRASGIKTIIIDNITWVSEGQVEKSRYSIPLMKQLKGLKAELGLSILILAHTPKIEGRESKPITSDDLAGHKSLANFADSLISVGVKYNDPSSRYVKVVTCRDADSNYPETSVAEFWFGKLQPNFLGFKYLGTTDEHNFLRPIEPKSYRTAPIEEDVAEKVRGLRASGKSYRAIAEELGVGKSTAERIATGKWRKEDEDEF